MSPLRSTEAGAVMCKSFLHILGTTLNAMLLHANLKTCSIRDSTVTVIVTHLYLMIQLVWCFRCHGNLFRADGYFNLRFLCRLVQNEILSKSHYQVEVNRKCLQSWQYHGSDIDPTLSRACQANSYFPLSVMPKRFNVLMMPGFTKFPLWLTMRWRLTRERHMLPNNQRLSYRQELCKLLDALNLEIKFTQRF